MKHVLNSSAGARLFVLEELEFLSKAEWLVWVAKHGCFGCKRCSFPKTFVLVLAIRLGFSSENSPVSPVSACRVPLLTFMCSNPRILSELALE
jgi:hypothetical protein